jgi:hypothetical protein
LRLGFRQPGLARHDVEQPPVKAATFLSKICTFFERTHPNTTVKREKTILNHENNSNSFHRRAAPGDRLLVRLAPSRLTVKKKTLTLL